MPGKGCCTCECIYTVLPFGDAFYVIETVILQNYQIYVEFHYPNKHGYIFFAHCLEVEEPLFCSSLCIPVVEHTDDSRSVGLAVTDTTISLVLENHQWPLPRLQASLSENIRGQQFVLLDRQKINNIATIVSRVKQVYIVKLLVC